MQLDLQLLHHALVSREKARGISLRSIFCCSCWCQRYGPILHCGNDNDNVAFKRSKLHKTCTVTLWDLSCDKLDCSSNNHHVQIPIMDPGITPVIWISHHVILAFGYPIFWVMKPSYAMLMYCKHDAVMRYTTWCCNFKLPLHKNGVCYLYVVFKGCENKVHSPKWK